jgi:hypothetical protein
MEVARTAKRPSVRFATLRGFQVDSSLEQTINLSVHIPLGVAITVGLLECFGVINVKGIVRK